MSLIKMTSTALADDIHRWISVEFSCGHKAFLRARTLAEEGFALAATKETYERACDLLSQFFLSGYLSSWPSFPIDHLADVVAHELRHHQDNIATKVCFAFLMTGSDAMEACKTLDDILSLLESSTAPIAPPPLISRVLGMRGFVHAMKGDAHAAFTDFERAVAEDRTNLQAMYLRSKTSRHVKGIECSLSGLREYISLAPRDEPKLPQVYYELIDLIYTRSKGECIDNDLKTAAAVEAEAALETAKAIANEHTTIYGVTVDHPETRAIQIVKVLKVKAGQS